MKTLATLTKIVAIIIAIAILIGFYVMQVEDDQALGDKIVGLSVLASVFILLPMFLYLRWKGKNLKDYTLSDENIRKMKDKNRK